MTPRQLGDLRAALYLSSAKMARTMGYSSGRLIQAWESGERPIPPRVALFGQLMIEIPEARDWLIRRLSARKTPAG